MQIAEREAGAHARPTAVDLYAGAGGLSLGMEQAGFDVIGAAEFDARHALAHHRNFPHTPVVGGDLSFVDPSEILAAATEGWIRHGRDGNFEGEIDALVGGPPCQGFSVGGVRDPNDERNQQLSRFADFVIALRPKVFLIENVAGLLEPRFATILGTLCDRLEKAGYEISGVDSSHNAADFGVPQNRRRLLLRGSRIGAVSPIVRTNQSVLVGEAFQGLADPQSYRRLLRSDEVELRESDVNDRFLSTSRYARDLMGIDGPDPQLSYSRVATGHLLTNSLRTVHQSKVRERFRRTAPGAVEPVSRLYRLDAMGLSRTLRAGTGSDRGSHTSPRPIHPTASRVITVREAARLHGYPDWFRFDPTNWHGHRQVGNSVPPPLAKAAGLSLLNSLESSVRDSDS